MSDTVFFVISKLVWAVISPDSLILLLALAAWVCLLAGRQKLARGLLSLSVFLLLTIGFLPVGEWLLAPLENRFTANTALPEEVDGIIVLGGAVIPTLSAAWDQVEMGDSGERLTTFRYLAGLYPGAQLVFTGGSGSLLEQELRETDYSRYLLEQLGLGNRAIVYESDSRNTFENARNSRVLLQPQAGQQWLLVTSAFHMPRAVGTFCRQQWPVQAVPVDHFTWRGNLLRIDYNFADNVGKLKLAIREWVGLVVYRVTGRSAQFLPGDNSDCDIRS